MATGTPAYPTSLDTDTTLGQSTGIVSGTTPLGASSTGQGTILGITKNLINTVIALENVVGIPGSLVSGSHDFGISTLQTQITALPTTGTTGVAPALPASAQTTKWLRGDASWQVIPTMTSAVGGLVPTPPGTTTTFLRGDATFAAIPAVTSSVSGLIPAFPNTATTFFRGDGTYAAVPAATATVSGLVPTPPNDATKFLRGDSTFTVIPTMSATVGGLVPTPPNNTTTFLRGDGTFAVPAGGAPWRQWNANEGFPPSSLYAVWSVVNSIPFLAFNDAATWTSVFMGKVPAGINLASGVIVRLFWGSATATSGNVVWGVAIERMGVLTVASDHFDTQATATTATNGTVELLTETAITQTAINSMVNGNTFRLQVQRLGASGSDTMTGDAQLFSVSIESA